MKLSATVVSGSDIYALMSTPSWQIIEHYHRKDLYRVSNRFRGGIGLISKRMP